MIRRIKRILKKLRRNLFSKTPRRKFYYGFFSKYFSINKKQILIESFHGQTINDSGLVFAREISKLYPDKYKIYYATEDKKKHQILVDSEKLDVTLVDVTTFKYTKILATSKYIISNASLPIYFVKREGQKYLQTWHGTPLKTLGKEMRLGIESLYNVQHNFLQADYLTQPNDFTKEVIMRDYNLEKLYTGKVVMSGYPRNKIFFDANAGTELRKKLGTEDKTVYAYMPTWRGTSNHSVDVSDYVSGVKAIFKKLDKNMKDDQILYVNFHPILHDTIKLGNYKHIKPFPKDVDNYTFLNSSDVLITDYSSVFFDFSITKKPVILFMYDYDEYLHDRGLYLDVKSLPFRQIYDTDEFVDCISNGTSLNDKYDDTEFYKTFFKYDSADNTQNLLSLLFDGDETNFQIEDYSSNCEKKLKVYCPARTNVKKYAINESVFKTLSKVANNEDSVVLLYKKWFKKEVSPLLYDKYNNDFTYVITTNTPPRTYFEQVLAFLGVKKYVNTIHKRDIERCFPNLNIDPVFDYDYSSFEDGCNVGLDSIITTEGEFSCVESTITVSFKDSKNLDLKEAVILSQKNTILKRWPLSKDEIDNLNVSYDIQDLVKDFSIFRKEIGGVGIIAEDEKGNSKLLTFTDISVVNKLPKKSRKETRHFYKAGIKTYSLPASYVSKNLVKYTRSVDEAIRNQLNSLDMTITDTEIAILPYIGNDKKFLQFIVCDYNKMMDEICRGFNLETVSCHGSKFKVKASTKQFSAQEIVGSELVFRSSTESLTVPLEIKTKQCGKRAVVKIYGDMKDNKVLKPVFWDIKINISGANSGRVRIANPGVFNILKLYFRNLQSKVDDVNIIFPYIGKGGFLCFTHRENTEYDTTFVRIKEIIALFVAIVFGPVLKRKKYKVIFEKFCKTAQDNSLFFFRYCMEQLPANEKKKIFYIIDKREPDYQNIKQYDKNIIQFMSLKHMIICLVMEMCISTDSTSHLYTWRPKPSVVRRKIKKQDELFLQHGVTALKRVDHLFGKKGTSPMKYFVATSKMEKEIVVNNFGYAPNCVPITGFARWDVLDDKSNETKDKFILVMPTWRSWLEETSEEQFVNSDYYENYSKFLTDEKLTNLLEKNDLHLVLYLHPKFAQYVETFKDKMSSRVSYVSFGEKPLNELMMECSMLITDYSSVCWDVLYQKKPVLFFHFDYDKYMQAHGSYLAMDTDLPSDRAVDKDTLLKYIEEYISLDFKMKEKYLENIDYYFEYTDDKNSKRTFDFIKLVESGGIN